MGSCPRNNDPYWQLYGGSYPRNNDPYWQLSGVVIRGNSCPRKNDPYQQFPGGKFHKVVVLNTMILRQSMCKPLIYHELTIFCILYSLSRISSENMELLQAGRIRQRLLQSIFLDRIFWAEAGGRHGIEIILDIIDGRVKELFEWLSRFSNSRKKRRKI